MSFGTSLVTINNSKKAKLILTYKEKRLGVGGQANENNTLET